MKAKPATQQTIASAQRPSGGGSSERARVRIPQANSAPSTPVAAHAAICHGVHGPCPKKKLEVNAARAPTANPGAPPSA